MRKQLDELVARKNEGSRGSDRQHSPTYGPDRPHEKPPEIPSLFDVMQVSDARPDAEQPLPRRHLLPAPRLVSSNLKGKPLLDLPEVRRPLDADRTRPDVDRERGLHYGGQPPNQPLLPPAAVLPGRPFVQEYSHKPAETHAADQLRFREVIDYTHSGKDAEPNRPSFREEPGQRRYRPYPAPKERHRMAPESSERGCAWHTRERQNEPREQRDAPAKTSDFNIAAALDRTVMEKVGLSEASSSEHSSPAFSAADQSQTGWQSAAATQPVVSTAAKPELPVVSGECLLPLSPPPATLPTGETLVDNQPGVQAPDATPTAENEAKVAAAADSHIPQPLIPFPVPPIPPNFPAFVQNVRNMMFPPRGRARVPFNPALAGNMQAPFLLGMFRPPPNLSPLVPPVSVPSSVRQDVPPMMTSANRASAPLPEQTTEASAASRKPPLLGDYPGNVNIPSLMDEVVGGVDSVPCESSMQRQSGEMPSGEEQAHAADDRMMEARPRLLESDGTRNVPDMPPTAAETGEDQFRADESREEGESGAIPPLMDFSVYRTGSSSSAAGAPEPRLPRFVPRMRGPPPPHVRGGRMPPAPPHGVPYGMRARRPPPRGADPVPFPRRGGPPPSFPPRVAPRYPKHHPAPPKLLD